MATVLEKVQTSNKGFHLYSICCDGRVLIKDG